LSNLDTRESLTRLEAINVAGDTALAMLILPRLVLIEHEFNNNIDNKVLFATNIETSTGYTNNQLALNWLEHFKLATRPSKRTRSRVQYSKE
jgi:hypothetical protein